jgi:hypothetical protein
MSIVVLLPDHAFLSSNHQMGWELCLCYHSVRLDGTQWLAGGGTGPRRASLTLMSDAGHSKICSVPCGPVTVTTDWRKIYEELLPEQRGATIARKPAHPIPS